MNDLKTLKIQREENKEKKVISLIELSCLTTATALTSVSSVNDLLGWHTDTVEKDVIRKAHRYHLVRSQHHMAEWLTFFF